MLNRKVVIYIPSTVGSLKNQHRVQENWVIQALERFSEWFGGATAQNAEGAWKSETQGLVREKIVLVYAFTDPKTLSVKMENVRALARELARDMHQECVSIETVGVSGTTLEFEYPQKLAA